MRNQDLKVRTYRYSIEVIRFLESLPSKRTYWIIADQLLRAATSIGSSLLTMKKKKF